MASTRFFTCTAIVFSLGAVSACASEAIDENDQRWTGGAGAPAVGGGEPGGSPVIGAGGFPVTGGGGFPLVGSGGAAVGSGGSSVMASGGASIAAGGVPVDTGGMTSAGGSG